MFSYFVVFVWAKAQNSDQTILNNGNRSIVYCLPKGDNPFVWNEMSMNACLPSTSKPYIKPYMRVYFVSCWCGHQIECRSHFVVFHLITTWTSNHGNKIQMNQKFHRKQIYSIEIRFFFYDFFVQLFLVPSFDSFVRSFSMRNEIESRKKKENPHYNMAFVTTICTLVWVLFYYHSKWELMWCNQGTVIHTKSTEQLCALTNSFIYISISYALPTHFYACCATFSSFFCLFVCMRHGSVCDMALFYNGKIAPANVDTIICCIHRPNFIKHLDS